MALSLLFVSAAPQERVDLPARDQRTVYDLAGIISAEDESTMEERHRALAERTPVSLSVVTFPHVGGEPLNEVLARAGSEWGLGRSELDNGILIALAMQEQNILIATGSGVEDYLTDERVQHILRQFIIARLRSHDLSGAMLHGSAALIAASRARYGIDEEEEEMSLPTLGGQRYPGRGTAEALVVVLFVAALMLRPVTRWMFARPRPSDEVSPAPAKRRSKRRGRQ